MIRRGKMRQMLARSLKTWTSITALAAGASFLLVDDFKRFFHLDSVKADAYGGDPSNWLSSVLQTNEDATKILQAQQYSRTVKSGYSTPIKWFETNHYNANTPIEDRHCECSLPLNKAFLFGIFDGHSGWHCSEYLRSKLPLYISLSYLDKPLLEEFEQLRLSPEDLVAYLGNPKDDCESFTYPHTYKEKQETLKTGPTEFAKHVRQAGSRFNRSDLFRYTFLSIDRDITREAVPDGKCNDTIWMGLSGAVAVTAFIQGNDLYVANTGDCRAVVATKSESGSWFAIPMSQDHNAENKEEVDRIKKEHPGENNVILHNRLLGQLQPLRSFGDVCYKWTKSLHREVLDQIYGRPVVPKSLYRTPPYLTAQPDVEYKRLDTDDRFVILATDGLWDTVSSDEAVAVVGKYLDDLADGVKHEENGATKLIRRALSQGSYERLLTMLKLPNNVKRSHHDDISVTVVYLKPE